MHCMSTKSPRPRSRRTGEAGASPARLATRTTSGSRAPTASSMAFSVAAATSQTGCALQRMAVALEATSSGALVKWDRALPRIVGEALAALLHPSRGLHDVQPGRAKSAVHAAKAGWSRGSMSHGSAFRAVHLRERRRRETE